MAEKLSFKNRFMNFIDKNARAIIAVQAFMIVFFLSACTFHDIIPVCHYLFGCDHAMH